MTGRAKGLRAACAAPLALAAAVGGGAMADDVYDYMKAKVELWASPNGAAATTGWLRARGAHMNAGPGAIAVALSVETEERERLCTQLFAFPTEAPKPLSPRPLEAPPRTSPGALSPNRRPFPNPSCTFRKVAVKGGCKETMCEYLVSVVVGPSKTDGAVMHVPEQLVRMMTAFSKVLVEWGGDR